MSIINYASREIQFKIVYYGPALCARRPTSATSISVLTRRIVATLSRSRPPRTARSSSTSCR